MLLEEHLGLLDLESAVQPQCNQLFPVAVALDDHGHNSPGTRTHIFNIGIVEDIYSTSENAHHLNSNHNTTVKRHSEGSTNGNVNSQNISLSGRESPHIAKEESLTDFMRDHPPSIQKNGPGSTTKNVHIVHYPQPWRGKQIFMTHRKIKPAQHAGQCISVDQMESTIPGFVTQLKPANLSKVEFQGQVRH
eukprot:15036484-Ditylum_brightwellii.AAC.1